jgi:hypothetical protein
MRVIPILTILCAFVPTILVAKDTQKKVEQAPPARPINGPPDVLLPGILRQDLFDRNNPHNLRHDYPSAPAQPGQF